MSSRTVKRAGHLRLVTKLALASAGGALGLLASPLVARAATENTGYGYGYGYGGSGATNSFLGSTLTTQTVMAAIPAGLLLAGAAMWERRRGRLAAEQFDG